MPSADDDAGSARRQRPEPGRDPSPIRLAQNEAAPEPDAAPTSRNFPIPGVKPESFETMMARNAARGAVDQAAARAATMSMPPPYRHDLPPKTYFVSEETYAAMRNTILAMPNLSPTERYVFMRLLSYEGTGYDSGGGSKGGISQVGVWHDGKDLPKLQRRVTELRAEEGRDTPVPNNVEDLTIEDIYDAMRAYARQEFGEVGAERFAKIDNRELAFQLFDLQFQYGEDTRQEVWNTAVRQTAENLPATDRDRFVELVRLCDPNVLDKKNASARATSAAALDGWLARAFASNLQHAKVQWWFDPRHEKRRSGYAGATRARIWGMTRQP